MAPNARGPMNDATEWPRLLYTDEIEDQERHRHQREETEMGPMRAASRNRGASIPSITTATSGNPVAAVQIPRSADNDAITTPSQRSGHSVSAHTTVAAQNKLPKNSTEGIPHIQFFHATGQKNMNDAQIASGRKRVESDPPSVIVRVRQTRISAKSSNARPQYMLAITL
jgi:hypothetical protein